MRARVAIPLSRRRRGHTQVPRGAGPCTSRTYHTTLCPSLPEGRDLLWIQAAWRSGAQRCLLHAAGHGLAHGGDGHAESTRQGLKGARDG
jgi:hypothetical protein